MYKNIITTDYPPRRIFDTNYTEEERMPTKYTKDTKRKMIN